MMEEPSWEEMIAQQQLEFLRIEESRKARVEPVSIHDLVAEDLEDRKDKGLSTYGRVLHAHNGRNALWDAYEEVLDLACYLRQKIEEDKVSDGTD